MNKAQQIILIGAGGHAKSVIDVIENATKAYEIVGYLDNMPRNDSFWKNFKYLGTDDEHRIQEKASYIISVGMIKNLTLREKLFEFYKNKACLFETVISKHALVSKYARIGKGCTVMNFTHINTGANIGENCIINNKALIEHDSMIGHHCHISTGAIVNADCKIGNNVFIGSNVTINRGIEICDHVIVGSGSVITKNIEDPGVYIGTPAKPIYK
jgi:sugar O-acyltransferase (sialic acid O-acetyltransferase NeuD family)